MAPSPSMCSYACRALPHGHPRWAPAIIMTNLLNRSFCVYVYPASIHVPCSILELLSSFLRARAPRAAALRPSRSPSLRLRAMASRLSFPVFCCLIVIIACCCRGAASLNVVMQARRSAAAQETSSARVVVHWLLFVASAVTVVLAAALAAGGPAPPTRHSARVSILFTC